jgi:uncharacterized protein
MPILIVLLLVMVWSGVWSGTALAAPTCGGKHILEDLKTREPERYQKIRAAADATPNARTILWRIEKAGVPSSHLMGTAHVTDQRLTKFSAETTNLIQKSRIVLLELAENDPQKFVKLIEKNPDKFFKLDEPSLEQLLTPDEFALLMKRTGGGDGDNPQQPTAMFQPWFYMALLALPECEGARMTAGLLSVDDMVSKLAKANKVAVKGLETDIGQIKAMASVPMADQIAQLKATLYWANQIEDQHETLNRLYLDRDLGAIWPMSIELAEKAGIARTAFDSFEKILITDRNKSMAEAAITHLAKGNAFIAVGALHLTGQGGLVELLRAKGYTLVAVN